MALSKMAIEGQVRYNLNSGDKHLGHAKQALLPIVGYLVSEAKKKLHFRVGGELGHREDGDTCILLYPIIDIINQRQRSQLRKFKDKMDKKFFAYLKHISLEV